MKGDNELAALIDAIDGDMALEVELGEALGKFRKRRDAAIRDMEAARLLPSGAYKLAQGRAVAPSTMYRRAERGRRLLRDLQHDATKG